MAMTSHRPGTVALQTAIQLESMVLATASISFDSLHSLLSEIGSVPNDSDISPDAFGVDKSSPLDQPNVVTKPDAENKDVDETDDDDGDEENDDNDEDSDDEDDDSGDDDEDDDDDDDDDEESSDEDGETDDDDDDSDEDEEDDDEEEEQNLPVFKKTK